MIKKDELIGKWISDPHEVAASKQEDVTLEFYGDGNLKYTIQAGDKKQVMLLTYEVEGEYLITDQPSKPRIEKTKAMIEDGELILDYNDAISRYIKVA
jgi:hypothetical protein